MANADEPWKVSAVVSALMELLLSILLLLSAVIAFITSRLVSYFDLEPPCTQIGCSHTLPPRFTNRRRTNHGEEDIFCALCPKCRSSFDFTNQRNERTLHSMNDTKSSSEQEASVSSLDNSSDSIIDDSIIDGDIHHLDEKALVSSDRQFVNIATCTKGIQDYKSFVKETLDNSGSFHKINDASQIANGDFVLSMKSRSDFTFASECNTANLCEASGASRSIPGIDFISHEKDHCKESWMVEDSSMQIMHDHCYYTPLKDKDEDEDLFHDSLEAILHCDNLNGHLVLKDDMKQVSESSELLADSLQRLLLCDPENIFKETKPDPKSLNGNHRSLMTLETEKTSVCEDSEDLQEPTDTTNTDDGEHLYVLLNSDDKDVHEPRFRKRMHCESELPLLNSSLDDDLEMPNILKMNTTIEKLLDSPRSSRSEDGPYHELDELGLQAITLEEGQHRYTLLDHCDGDSVGAPDLENMLSDCAQPLLEGVQKDELEALRLSLNGMCIESAASESCITGANVKQFADASSHYQLPEETRWKAACLKAMTNMNHLQAEANLQGFSSHNYDICLGVSRCLAVPGCDEAVENNIDNKDHRGLLTDFEIVCGVREVDKIDFEESLVGLKSGCIAFTTPKVGAFKDAESFDGWGSKSLVNEEALISKVFETKGLHKHRNASQGSSSGFSEECQRCQQVLMGLGKSGIMQAKKDSLLQESQQQTVNTNDWQVEVEDHEQVLSVAAEIQQLETKITQADKDQEDGVIAFREALWAERTMLAALETELENERNAAAVATSQAMAMISRLQEEKSAMQLKVAQLQRMAEEKAEYDEQAMAVLKEILFKREAEKHALEKEVELYKQNFRSEREKNEKKGSSICFCSSLLLSSREVEEKGRFSSPNGDSTQQKTLGLLSEFHNSEDMSVPLSCEEQNTLPEENTQQIGRKFAKTSESMSLKGSHINDQIDSSVVEGKEGSASLLIQSSGPNNSMFPTNDEETGSILERLWALEEELQELQAVNHMGGQKKSFEICCLDCSHESDKNYVKDTRLCPSREVGEPADENGIGACLPVHDVYEVRSTPSQQDQYNDGVPVEEEPTFLEGMKGKAATKRGHSLEVIASRERPFTLNESKHDIANDAGQIETCAENACAILLKSTEEQVVSTDVNEQLAVRVQMLESNRDILKELSEHFKRQDVEHTLLQEIAQNLRELRQVGFHSISTVATCQDPVAKWSCSGMMKKQRRCSDPWPAEVVLLQQRSI